jgi:hypothetical protein
VHFEVLFTSIKVASKSNAGLKNLTCDVIIKRGSLFARRYIYLMKCTFCVAMQNNHEAALRDCGTALTHEPQDPMALLRAGTYHMRLGALHSARSHFARFAALPEPGDKFMRSFLTKRAELDLFVSEHVAAPWALLRAAATSPPDKAASEVATMEARALKTLSERIFCGELVLLRAAAALFRGNFDAALRLLEGPVVTSPGSGWVLQLQAWWLACDALFLHGDLALCAQRILDGVEDLACWEKDQDKLPLVGVQLPRSAEVRKVPEAITTALEHKRRGNELVKCKNLVEAEQEYSAALGIPAAASPSFHAVLYHNRSACLQVGCVATSTMQHAIAILICCIAYNHVTII